MGSQATYGDRQERRKQTGPRKHPIKKKEINKCKKAGKDIRLCAMTQITYRRVNDKLYHVL